MFPLLNSFDYFLTQLYSHETGLILPFKRELSSHAEATAPAPSPLSTLLHGLTGHSSTPTTCPRHFAPHDHALVRPVIPPV